MAPKQKEFDAICLVIDVGPSSVSSEFLKSALQCASELVQRKLFSESTDKFGLVLVGSERTDNGLNYDNVTLVTKELVEANFGLLAQVQKEIEATVKNSATVDADWLDGVIVALDFLKTESEDEPKCKQRKIVLLSNLDAKEVESKEQVEKIAKTMNALNVEFVFIGPEWEQDNDDHNNEPNEPQPSTSSSSPENKGDESTARHRKPKSSRQISSLPLISFLVEETEGLLCDTEEALNNLMYRERRAKKPFPWKVALQIGSNITINVVGYIKVRREAPKTWKTCLADNRGCDDEDELKADVSYVRAEDDQQGTVEREELVESFKYGSTLVTMPDEVKSNYAYRGGPKCLSLIGFASLSDVCLTLMLGDGCMIFQAADEEANVALSALAFAMYDLQHCAVVRKVYREGSSPRMGIIVPEMQPDEDGNDHLALVFVELPYSDDLRQFTFAPVYNDEIRPSPEQLSAVDSLIDSMMLIDDDQDLLNTASVLNPSYQHLYHCLSHRALNPGMMLPGVADHVSDLMQPPKKVLERPQLKRSRDQLREMFKLEIIEAKKAKTEEQAKESGEASKNEVDKSNPNENSDKGKTAVTEVGDADPVSDFKALIAQGSELIVVGQQMEASILKLAQSSTLSTEELKKFIDCLRAYRSACLQHDNPFLYNDFMLELKHVVGKKDFWKDVGKDGGVGPIVKSEHEESDVNSSENFFK